MASQCGAYTKKGTKCRNPPCAGEEACRQHKDGSDRLSPKRGNVLYVVVWNMDVSNDVVSYDPSHTPYTTKEAAVLRLRSGRWTSLR